MLAALGALKKALGWALEMVMEKAPKSNRLWADSWSNEKAFVWTLGEVRTSVVNVGEAIGYCVGHGKGHSVGAIVRVLD